MNSDDINCLGWGQFGIRSFRAGHGLGTKWAPHQKWAF